MGSALFPDPKGIGVGRRMGKEDPMSEKKASSERPRKKRRRHGYRGYGSPLAREREYGGAIHWGRGFTGVGFPGESGGLLPTLPEVLPEDLRVQDHRKGRRKP